jgi:UDP:flavonoid glycosyltransferase YjiC (YdhE family)
VRVLVSSTSGYGHVLPMVPLARAMLARGHDVLWATSADAAARVRGAGIETADAGMTETEIGPVRADLRHARAGLPPEELAAYVFPRMFGAARTPPMLAALLPIARQWAPDLLVHEQGEFAAPLVGTELGVPHVTHAFGGATPAETVAAAAERVAGLWAALGRDMPAYAGCYEHLYLDICPPSLQTVSLAHIRDVQPLQPVSYTGDPTAPLPTGLAGDDDRPLVYLTLGTVQDRSTVLRPVVAALAALDLRLLVTVGPLGDPDALGPQPSNVVVERYLPQTAVLPLCAAVVSHAGSGTVLGAAALALPQVCLPQGADQFRNACGIVRAGAGVALHPDQATPDAVAQAVHDVLTRPEHRVGAGEVRAEIEAMPAPADVVTRLEELVSAG